VKFKMMFEAVVVRPWAMWSPQPIFALLSRCLKQGSYFLMEVFASAEMLTRKTRLFNLALVIPVVMSAACHIDPGYRP
jgi:hypothetical protein